MAWIASPHFECIRALFRGRTPAPVAPLVQLYLQTRAFQNKNETAACHEKALTDNGIFAVIRQGAGFLCPFVRQHTPTRSPAALSRRARDSRSHQKSALRQRVRGAL